MAAGLGRLGQILSHSGQPGGDADDELDDVLAALEVLAAEPSPRGREQATATRLQDWAASRWPHLDWRLEPAGGGSLNLVAAHVAEGPLLYSHLDTSLDGTARDELVTGRPPYGGPLLVTSDAVEGFGLTVARAPAAVALAAFVRARAGSLLLAAAGTHRRGGTRPGVVDHLAAHPAPPAAVVAKCGPAGVLWSEPGAAYLTVRVSGRPGVALLPDTALPSAGVVQHAGAVLDAVARWRSHYLASTAGSAQVGPGCGIGAVTAGWPDKPDLLPASVAVSVYVATVPDADVTTLAGELAAIVRAACDAGPLATCTVDVDIEVVHAAAQTDRNAPIVAAARAEWTREFGAPAEIDGWAGSTDGVVLRAAGIPTVRLGPAASQSSDDPRRDVLRLPQLAAFVRIYRALLDGTRTP